MKKRFKLSTLGVSGAYGASGARARVRRSVTIVEANRKQLQKARGMLLLHTDIDLDYTTALNLFLHMGLKKFNSELLDEEELTFMMNEQVNIEITKDDLEEMKTKIDRLATIVGLEEKYAKVGSEKIDAK